MRSCYATTEPCVSPSRFVCLASGLPILRHRRTRPSSLRHTAERGVPAVRSVSSRRAACIVIMYVPRMIFRSPTVRCNCACMCGASGVLLPSAPNAPLPSACPTSWRWRPATATAHKHLANASLCHRWRSRRAAQSLLAYAREPRHAPAHYASDTVPNLPDTARSWCR